VIKAIEMPLTFLYVVVHESSAGLAKAPLSELLGSPGWGGMGPFSSLEGIRLLGCCCYYVGENGKHGV
jgi:hypothetical protein